MKFHIFFNCWWLKLFGRKTLILRNWAFMTYKPYEAWDNGTGRYLAGLYSFVAENDWATYYQDVDKYNDMFNKIEKVDGMMQNIWLVLCVNGVLPKKPIYNIKEEDVVVDMKIKEIKPKKEKK